MQRITGLPDEQVAAFEVQIEAVVRAALAQVMDTIARRVEANMPVLASALVGTGEDDLAPLPPPDDALPPGQPYVSPDDLASIPPLWQQAVVEQVLPIAAQVFMSSVGKVHADMIDASSIAGLPSVGSLAAEQYLAQAHNTFDQIGDHLWATARQQLSEGFEAGESIPQLAERLRSSAEVTARTGVLVARTQVIEASNAGSFAVAQASGLQMKKEWIATPDLRTRPTHLAADGQRVDLNEPFIVGGFSAMYPAAATLPPAERYSCRCTTGYVMPDKAPGQVRAQDALDQQIQDLPGTSGIDDIAAQQSARLQAIIDQQHADVEAAIEEVHRRFGETFGREAGPGFDLPARGEHPQSYIRPSLAGAKTPRELRRVWQDEVQAITGHPFLVDRMPTGISMVTAREYAEGALQMFAQFPEAKIDRIHWFDDAASSAYAQVRRGGHAIEFNMRYASEKGRPKFLEARRRDADGWDSGDTSWGVRNDRNGQGVVYHEFTHILDIENAREAVHGRIVPLLIQHAQREGITDIDDLIKRRISSYATKNYQEMVAEAGADVMVNGAAASQLSRDIFDLLRTEYRARGFGLRTAPIDDLAAEAERLGEIFPKTPGWAPGRWEAAPLDKAREEIAEREFEDYVKNQEQFDLAVDESYGRKLGKGIAEQELPASAAAYRNGPYTIIVRDAENVSDDALRAMQNQMDAVLETNPLDGRPFTLRLGGTSSTGNAAMSGPEGISMFDEIEMAPRGDLARRHRFLMPSAVEHPKAVYDLTHELGHSHMLQDPARGVRARALYEELDLKRARLATMRGEVNGIRPELDTLGFYGASDPLEAYAEAFAEWNLSAGLTENAMVLRYAREFGWRDPLAEIGQVFPKAAGPRSLAELASETPSRVTPLEGGITAKVERLDYPGGESAVRKDYLGLKQAGRLEDQVMVARIHVTAEDLASDVLRAVGVRAPAVVRLNDHSLLMEFVEGQQGGETGVLKAPAKIVASAEGRRLGLADALMGHRDRGGGNWMRAPDGGIVAIDNGGAFAGMGADRAAAGNPFTSFLMGRYGEDPWKTKIELPSDIDLAQIRRGLTALKPKFDEVGYQRQFKDMMGRLDEIERRVIRVPPAPQLTLDVPPLPRVVAPRSVSSMTVADLRAELKAADVAIPAGARKADLVRLVEERRVPGVPAPAGPLSLAARAKTKIVDLEPLPGGQNATVQLATFEDGTQAVKKTARVVEGRSAKLQQDAEEIEAKLLDAFGIRAPETVRVSSRVILQERIPGTVADDLPRVPGKFDVAGPYYESDEGRVIGLVDALTDNYDRNAGNWIVTPDGHLAGIDHGLAFQWPGGDSRPSVAPYASTNPFNRHLSSHALGHKGEWVANDYSSADMASARQILDSMRPEFERLGHRDWYDRAVERLGYIEQHATGTAVRITPRVVRELPPPPPLSRAPLAYQARQDALRADAARPVIKDEQVYGGESAYVRRLEHEGGPPTITKDTMRIHQTKTQGARDADAEELGSLTSEAVGIRAPTIIRLDRTKVEMEVIEGKPGGGSIAEIPRGTVFEETDDGRLMGLLDYLTGNSDRSDRNWFLLPDGHMASIDMGDAFLAPKLAGTRDNFGSSLILDEAGKYRKIIDINPADLTVIRARLEALRPEFERLGRATWHRQVMARLADVEKRADPAAAIRLAEARPDLAAVKAAQRTAARTRAAEITTQRANAALIARVDELVQAKASKAVIRQELDPALREAEQLYAGADKAVADALRTAVDSGDAAKIRAALTRQSKVSKVTPIGKAGAKAKFDPDTMEGVGGTAIPDGADVIVVRRGARIEGIETPEKATVRLARAPSSAKTVAKGDFTGLTRTSEALGGNPGGIFEAGDGSRWYVKAVAGDAQARSEALALDLYRAAGLDAPELVIGEGVEGLGRRQIATRFLDDAQVDLRARLADDPAYIAEVQDGFATDAWLANWDVVGANPAPGKGWDNIVSVGSHPVRIEAGGALRFRGLGGEKAFGDDVLEFDTLRDTATARRAAQIFGDMTPEQLIASAERVRKVTPAKIKALVKKHGLDPELADTLIARRADILRRAEALAGPKPMTVREFNAAIKAAAKRQDALDAVEAGVTRHVEDSGDLPIRTIWRGGIERDQKAKDVIDRYLTQQFEEINGALRLVDSNAATLYGRPLVPDLDRILDGSRLTVDAELWRAPGSGRGIFGDPGTWGDDLAGFEWSDPAFSSASASRAVADRFTRDGGVRLRMLTPKGSKALQLSPMKSPLAIFDESAAEAEVLLARGARYRVVRDRGWTTIKHPTTHQTIRVRDLDVEVTVPDETPPLPWATK